MKIREIIKTIFAFLVSIIILCFIVVIAISVMECKKHPDIGFFEQVISSFLYVIGYDSLYSDSWSAKCLLAIIGLFALSFLSAYLTVLFLYRTDVKIYNKIFVWKSAEGKYYGSIIIKNTGKTVCDLRMSISLYGNDGKQLIHDICERSSPILLKQSPWRVNFLISPIEDNFFYEVFQNYINRQNCTLYVLWSFVDDMTGQETIHVQPYTYSDCIFGTFRTPGGTMNKKYISDPDIESEFIEWMSEKKHIIPLSKAIPINATAIQLTHTNLPDISQDTMMMTMAIDYSQVNLNALEPEFFVMASIQFKVPEDWSIFFDKQWVFQFQMFGDADEIEKVTLEIKKRERLEKVLWREFTVVESLDLPEARCSIPLTADGLTRTDFREIKEVDFTIFLKHMKNHIQPHGRVTIIDCVLAKPVEPIGACSNPTITENIEIAKA